MACCLPEAGDTSLAGQSLPRLARRRCHLFIGLNAVLEAQPVLGSAFLEVGFRNAVLPLLLRTASDYCGSVNEHAK